MLGFTRSISESFDSLKIKALDRSMAVIEFKLDGTIITANANFLRTLGYTAAEIEGRHHSMFVTPAEAASPEYRAFWDKLGRGEFTAGQFKRIGKGGREVWIEATYNPVLDRNGRPLRVVKFASDISERMALLADLTGKADAIGKSNAVIEFTLDGTILTANQNFLNALGYGLDEIKGRHHSMFVDPAMVASDSYKAFWAELARGAYQAGQYRRIGKGGREVWIEASYNPVVDANGRPVKVVKYATDVTRQVKLLTDLKTLIDRNFGEIDAAVDTSRQQTDLADGAAAETSGNVQTVASATEELAASIREISESMAKSRAAAERAVERTRNADDATRRLTGTAQSMTGIVDLIQRIAGQINLLALNATIEAARAGDAGRGFAVVATEVKNLANQAADATTQIAREIDGVQSVSAEVVGTLAAIREAIDGVREYVSGTAAAIEEQTAVTRDMSANMQSAAAGVGRVSGSVTEIGRTLEQVTRAVRSTKQAAEVLAR